jgi:hypothetical protein
MTEAISAELQRLKNSRSALMHIACSVIKSDPELAKTIDAACLKIGEAVEVVERAWEQ